MVGKEAAIDNKILYLNTLRVKEIYFLIYTPFYALEFIYAKFLKVN